MPIKQVFPQQVSQCKKTTSNISYKNIYKCKMNTDNKDKYNKRIAWCISSFIKRKENLYTFFSRKFSNAFFFSYLLEIVYFYWSFMYIITSLRYLIATRHILILLPLLNVSLLLNNERLYLYLITKQQYDEFLI